MMNAEQLSRVGEKLVKRCGSRDPFEIARQLGINVMLCENFGSLKGMYRVIKRNRFIFLNNSLDENMLRIVCAHELGHDQLHRNEYTDTILPCARTFFTTLPQLFDHPSGSICHPAQ